MRRASSLAWAIFGIVVSSASLAAAERVVLVRPLPDDALLVDAWHRMEAELHIHRFSTEAIDAPADAAPRDVLSDAARRGGAFAAIALVHHDASASVDVWLVDRRSGKTTMRTIDVKDGEDASSVLAIRAVDLLRASLREFSAGAGPPADVVGVERGKPDAALREFVERPEPALHARADALLLFERNLGVAAGPSLGIAYRLVDSLEVGVEAAGPLLGGRLSTSLGSANTHQEEAWADVRVRLLRASIVSAGVDAGGGVHFLTAQGSPHLPLRAQTETLAAFLACAGVHLDVALSSTFTAGVGVRAILTAPRLGVAVDTEASPIAAPIIAASAGIRVGL